MSFQEGHNDDAQSLFSVQTTTCGLPVGWLLLPNNISDNKYQDILDCLAGTPDERISLWKLRELALSPGGLLCPQVRKRAWPMILLGCQQQIFLSSQQQQQQQEQSPSSQVTPSPEDLQALERDIEKTLWNVEEHLMSSKLLQQQQEEAMKRAILLRTKQAKKRVSFALPLLDVSDASKDANGADNVMDDQHSPSSLASNESSGSLDSPQAAPPSDKDENNVERATSDPSPEAASLESTMEPALKKSPLDNTISTEQGDMYHDDDISTVETQETDSSFTVSSRLAHWRDASRQEQKVLFNVVASVLRMTSNCSTDAYFEDDDYHYVKGLHNVAAILMINLESPSLTTCVFQQLAALHFRDAMRPSSSNTITKLMEATLPTLLRQVDPVLYELLWSSSASSSSSSNKLLPVHSWLTCWFTQDISDLRVASRLMDVLLVSHPLMSVYLAVAIWTVQRESLLLLLSQEENSSEELRGLATDTLTVEQTEHVIAKALEMMKRVPPAKLIQQAHTVVGEQHANSISLLQPVTPAWLSRNECWTEWALWRRVRELRQTGEEHKLIQLLQNDSSMSASRIAREYPLAWTAIGGADDSSKKVHRRKVVVLLLGAACLIVLTGMVVMPGRTPSTTLPRILPKKSLVKKASPLSTPVVVDTKECTTSASYPWMDLLTPGIMTLGACDGNNVVSKVHSELQSRKSFQNSEQKANRRAKATQNLIHTWKKQSELPADTVGRKIAQDSSLVMQRSRAFRKGFVNIWTSSMQLLANFTNILEKGWVVVTNPAGVLFVVSIETLAKCGRFLKNDSVEILKQAPKQAMESFANVLMEQSWAFQAEKSLTHQQPMTFQRPMWLSDLRNEHFEPLWWKNLANEDFKTLW